MNRIRRGLLGLLLLGLAAAPASAARARKPNVRQLSIRLQALATLAAEAGQKKDFDQAEKYFLKTLEVAEPSGDKRLISMSLGMITGFYLARPRPLKGLEYSTRLLEITRAEKLTTEAEYLNLTSLLELHAAMLMEAVRFREAGKVFTESLNIRRKVFGADHILTSMTMAQIAYLHLILGNHEKAGRLAEKSLALMQKSEKREVAPRSLATLVIGYSRYAAGDLAECRTRIEQALELQAGENVLLRLGTHVIAGQIYEELGDHKRAVVVLQEALSLVDPDDSKSTGFNIDALNALALIQAKTGNFEEARKNLKRIGKPIREIGVKKHPRIITSLRTAARLRTKDGKHEAAAKLLQRAVGMTGDILGKGHPHIALVLAELAEAQLTLGKKAEAKASVTRALGIAGKRYGEGHPIQARLNGLLPQTE